MAVVFRGMPSFSIAVIGEFVFASSSDFPVGIATHEWILFVSDIDD